MNMILFFVGLAVLGLSLVLQSRGIIKLGGVGAVLLSSLAAVLIVLNQWMLGRESDIVWFQHFHWVLIAMFVAGLAYWGWSRYRVSRPEDSD